MRRRSFLASATALFARTNIRELADEFRRLAKLHGVTHGVAFYRDGQIGTFAEAGAAKRDTVFLLASITKPMTAVAVMKLVDRGLVKLADPVRKYIPEFSGGDRDSVTVKHILSHTSGLPDMLPENDDLRKRHAPLKDFVRLTCKTPLLFKPGTECRYQSMGILLAAELVERAIRQPLPAFLATEVFPPLAMLSTSLGLGKRQLKDTAPSQVTGNDDWNWNSPYWRGLGAPWGGALATANDVAHFLGMFMNPEGQTVLTPKTARAMLADQNAGLNKAWGIGWAVNARREQGGLFGKGCSPTAFGHGGSTGTLCWADPAQDKVLVILTTKPAAESNKTVLHPVSDLASV